MPSATVTRERVHTRTITLDGYSRSDGLMDIEGEIKDVKTYDFPNRDRGVIHADEALHHMKVRIAIDETMTIREAEAETIAGPYHICPSATRVFGRLVGLTIAPGWRNIVRKAIGGVEGCTHITELMGPVATVAYQTLYGEKARKNRATPDNANPLKEEHDTLINSCIGHAEDPETVLAGLNETRD